MSEGVQRQSALMVPIPDLKEMVRKAQAEISTQTTRAEANVASSSVPTVVSGGHSSGELDGSWGAMLRRPPFSGTAVNSGKRSEALQQNSPTLPQAHGRETLEALARFMPGTQSEPVPGYEDVRKIVGPIFFSTKEEGPVSVMELVEKSGEVYILLKDRDESYYWTNKSSEFARQKMAEIEAKRRRKKEEAARVAAEAEEARKRAQEVEAAEEEPMQTPVQADISSSSDSDKSAFGIAKSVGEALLPPAVHADYEGGEKLIAGEGLTEAEKGTLAKIGEMAVQLIPGGGAYQILSHGGSVWDATKSLAADAVVTYAGVKFFKIGGKIITKTGGKVLELVKDGGKVFIKEGGGELGKALTGPRLAFATEGPASKLIPSSAPKPIPAPAPKPVPQPVVKKSPANVALSQKNGKPVPKTPVKSTPKPEAPKPQRVIPTKEMQNACWEKLKQSGDWKHSPHYSKPTLENKKTGQFVQKSIEKWEMEAFSKREKHIGIMRPDEPGTIRTEFAVRGRKMEK